MADRRMFSKTLMGSNAFTSLGRGAQLLYIYLCLQADDDGICGATRAVCRMCGCGPKTLQQLLDGGWLIGFDTGPVAITHWHIHNQLRKDRYRPSLYTQEAARLRKGKDGAYELCEDGCHLVANLATQDREEEDSQGKLSLAKGSKDQVRLPDDDSGSCEIDFEKLLSEYQALCPSLQYCAKVNDYIREQATRAWEEGYRMKDFVKVFRMAEEAPYLQGDGQDGWIAGLGWLVRPESMRKVLGNAFNRRKAQPVSMGASGELGQAELEAIQKLLAEE